MHWLTVSERIDQACEVAIRCAVSQDHLGLLHEALSKSILDRTLSADDRLRLIGRARTIFPDLLSTLRREKGLAGDPLPNAGAWSEYDDAKRVMTCLTVASEALQIALTSAGY